MARLALAITPWEEVYVDGRKKGVSPPLAEVKLAPGKHVVEIRNTAFQPRQNGGTRRQWPPQDQAHSDDGSRKATFNAVHLCRTACACLCSLLRTTVKSRPSQSGHPPSKSVTPAKAKQEPETPKEPVALPKPQASQVPTPSRANRRLKGASSYEDSEYKTAAKQLQAALDLGLDEARPGQGAQVLGLHQLRNGPGKVMSRQFSKALDADPKFALEPAKPDTRSGVGPA
jgi:hypothetical protein